MLRVRTMANRWRRLNEVLLPGDIVPGDGSRDDAATVDTDFHEADVGLLRNLAVVDSPQSDRDLSSEESVWQSFLFERRNDFRKRSLRQKPQRHLLNFRLTIGSGPLQVLRFLSDEGRTRYTHALLSLDATYQNWEMYHDTVKYPSLKCESPAFFELMKYGRVQTPDGSIPFMDALGNEPNPAALHALLVHPKADNIKGTFVLADPTPEFFGERDAIPLTDVWPGFSCKPWRHSSTGRASDHAPSAERQRRRPAAAWSKSFVAARSRRSSTTPYFAKASTYPRQAPSLWRDRCTARISISK